MEIFYKSIKAIIGFLIITLIIETTLGEETARKMTLFVLIGMFIIDGKYTDSLANFLSNFSSNES